MTAPSEKYDIIFEEKSFGAISFAVSKVTLRSAHQAFIANFHQRHAHHNPEDFADAGEERNIDAQRAARAGKEDGHNDRQTALACPNLHGQEEEEVAHQRGKAQDDEGIDEGDAGHSEGQEDEEKFKGVEEAPHVFEGERAPKLPRMLVEETDVGIGGVEGRAVAFVEAVGRTTQEGDEEEEAEEAGDDAILVAVAEEEDGGHKHHEITPKEAPKPRRHLVKLRADEGDERCGPKEEMAEHVHHGIERH